jgi:hypothetical protein
MKKNNNLIELEETVIKKGNVNKLARYINLFGNKEWHKRMLILTNNFL